MVWRIDKTGKAKARGPRRSYSSTAPLHEGPHVGSNGGFTNLDAAHMGMAWLETLIGWRRKERRKKKNRYSD